MKEEKLTQEEIEELVGESFEDMGIDFDEYTEVL